MFHEAWEKIGAIAILRQNQVQEKEFIVQEKKTEKSEDGQMMGTLRSFKNFGYVELKECSDHAKENILDLY